MERLQVVDALQTAHDRYFRLLLENYPLLHQSGPLADFGPPELCELAIEAHSCAISLGSIARERLIHLGFDLLYPFDNPVDLYNWRARVKAKQIDHTVYSSIAIRIDSELKRIRRTVELDGGSGYEGLPTGVFLVSSDRYNLIPDEPRKNRPNEEDSTPNHGTNVQIGTINVGNAADSAAISSLERLEKKTTVWSNFSNIVNVLRSLVGG